MDEAQARDHLSGTMRVSRETMERLEVFVHRLAEENERQNLVSQASLEQVWCRHILDSAQLLRLAPEQGSWIDLGTGPGLPGVVIALLRQDPVVLVEERKRRVEFLEQVIEILGLKARVTVIGKRVEAVEPQVFSVISARAFAPLGRLLALGQRFAASGTHWVLPKGKNARAELEEASASWQGDFRLEPSLTDADASIIVAERVSRRGIGKRKI